MKKRTTLVFLILSIILLLFSLAACTKKEQKQKTFVIREDLTREEILQTLKDCDSFTIGGEVIVKEFVEKGYDFYDTVATYVTNSGVTLHNKWNTGEGINEVVETYLADGDKGHEFYWRNRDGKIEDSYELIDVNTIKPKERVLDPELSWEAKQIESWPYIIKNNQIVFEEEKGGYIYKIVIKDINNTKLIIPDRYKNYKLLGLEAYTDDNIWSILGAAKSFTIESEESIMKFTENGNTIISNKDNTTCTEIQEDGKYINMTWKTGDESTATYTADDYDHIVVTSTKISNIKNIKDFDGISVKARYENGELVFDVIYTKPYYKMMTYKNINNTQLEIPEKYKDYKNLPLTSKFSKNSSLDDVRKIMAKTERFYVEYKYYDSNGREIPNSFSSSSSYYQKGYRKGTEKHYFENGIEYISTGSNDKQVEKREATETYNYVDKVNEVIDRIEGNEYKIQDDVIICTKKVVINSQTYSGEMRISCYDKYVPEQKQYNEFDVVSSLNGVFENTLERPSSDVESAGDSLQGKTKEQIIELLKSANNYTALIEKEYGGITSTTNLFLSKEKGMSQLKLNFDNGPVLAYYAEFVEDRLYMLEAQSTLFGGDTYSRAYANDENVTNESIFGKYTLGVIKYIESEGVEMTIYGNMVMFEKSGLKVLVKDVDNTTPIIVSECRGYESLRTSDASEKVLSALPTEQVFIPSWNLKSDGDSMEGMTLEQIKQYVLSSSSCTFLWYIGNDSNEECENIYLTRDGVSGVHWENRKNVEKMGFYAELFKNGKQFSLAMEMVVGEPIATANSVVLNDESFPYESALSDLLSGVEDMSMTIRGNMVMFEKDGVKLMIKDVNHTVLQLPEQFWDYENLPLTKNQ